MKISSINYQKIVNVPKEVSIGANILLPIAIFLIFTLILLSCSRDDLENTNTSPIVFNPNLTYGSVTDIDGNTYKTITIGEQTWMAEDLRVTKYSNGDAIHNITSNASWLNYTTGAQGNITDFPNLKLQSQLGRIYNWYAVADNRNIAPSGWHVATDNEWITLEYYLINKGYFDADIIYGISRGGGVRRSISSTTYWNEEGQNNDVAYYNTSGFSALPNYSYGTSAGWWCANNWVISISKYSYKIGKRQIIDVNDKKTGCAIRCIKDNPIGIISTANPSTIIATNAKCGGNIALKSGSTIISRGVCCSSSSTMPTINDIKTINGSGAGSFISSITGLTANTTYYVRAYATNTFGTFYGDIKSFTTYDIGTQIIYDIEGNEYHTQIFGGKEWMIDNLKTKKYRNGDPIPNITDKNTWVALKNGAYCNYNNDINISNKQGCLYNFYAVADSRNIAPNGWHVASYTEWINARNQLYLGLNSGCGQRDNYDYGGIDFFSVWWSSSDGPNYGWMLSSKYENPTLNSGGASKYCGAAVRCVKD